MMPSLARGAIAKALPSLRCWCGVLLPLASLCRCGMKIGKQRRYCSATCRRTWDRIRRRIARRREWLANWRQEKPGRYSAEQIRFQVAALVAEIAALERELTP